MQQPQTGTAESPPATETPPAAEADPGGDASPAAPQAGGRRRRVFFISLTVKNLVMFLVVFLVAIAPLVHSYWSDAKENRIKILSSQLELIGKKSIGGLRPEELAPLVIREMTDTYLHKIVVAKLRRIQTEFEVDNAILMRRGENGKFSMIADGSGQFYISESVFIHERFPDTLRAAEEAWQMGKPVRTGLFGFGEFEYLQVYVPIMDEGRVVATLLLNKFAEDVDQAIRAKTVALLVFTGVLALLGVAGFWFFSNRMLAPLLRLKEAALRIAAGDLEVEIPPMNRRDEVSDMSESFRHMVDDLRTSREEVARYNAQLERTLARVRLMEDLEKNLSKFVPREVAAALHSDPEALERGKTEQDVTVLFLDMQGSTTLAQSLGAQSIDRLIEVYFSKFLDSIYENEGDITETAGDGLMLIFQGEEPSRHAVNAVKTAVAIQRTTREIQDKLISQEERVRINIGICSGRALVGFTKFEAITGARITFTATGLTTIVAARLADLAKDGTVLISKETMSRLAEREDDALRNIRPKSLGDVALKNVQETMEVYRLEGA